MTDLSHLATQRVVDAASRRGIELDVRHLASAPRSVEDMAATLDVDRRQIVGSLVFVATRSGGRLAPIVSLISGRNTVDLAALSAVTGEVAIRLANATETYDLTGYSTGGTPPFGYGRDVRVFMDQDLCGYPWVWAAAGTATAVFRISPRTLRMLSNAFVVPLAVGPWIAPSRPTEVKPRFRPETSRGPLPAPARPTGQHPSSGEPLPPSWQRALLRDLDLELV